jgi:FtsP/CotA-like multicopper oxidase with cupredoxin domain
MGSAKPVKKAQVPLPVDSCAGAVMTASGTNLHFHGLSIPPACHQDETLRTLVRAGDMPFEYRITIPKNQPPGLYWYHQHVHGFSEEQVLGGASGAIIIEGVDRENSMVAGLPERILIVRDQKMPPDSPSASSDPNKPTKELSLNFIPVPYPSYPPGVIRMKPSERQFWRVLNAAADTYLDLRVEFDGKPQELALVSRDGVPLRYDQHESEGYVSRVADIFLPPAGRAEFIMTGPPAGVNGRFLTNGVYRGAGDDNGRPIHVTKSTNSAIRAGQDDIDPTRPLATIIAAPGAPTPSLGPLGYSSKSVSKPIQSLATVRPVRVHKLYFSEKQVDPNDPKSATLFFITEEGQIPTVFDTNAAVPNITVRAGDVEDWIIENRSQESHVFHIHQLHFLVVGMHAVPWEESSLRDTVNLPAWSGFGQYPSLTLRMDFRDTNVIGTFTFHCHIAQHSDGGMMGTVRVEAGPQR